MRAGMTVLGLILMGSPFAVATQPPSKQARSATIQEPSQNEAVAVRHEVVGKVPEKGTTVWVIVHPRMTPDCWVQSPSISNSDGSWRVMAQFGENRPEHSGQHYEIRALTDPKGKLTVGKTACWPDAGSYSDSVYVVRK
jgi:hypothetical protein